MNCKPGDLAIIVSEICSEGRMRMKDGGQVQAFVTTSNASGKVVTVVAADGDASWQVSPVEVQFTCSFGQQFGRAGHGVLESVEDKYLRPLDGIVAMNAEGFVECGVLP